MYTVICYVILHLLAPWTLCSNVVTGCRLYTDPPSQTSFSKSTVTSSRYCKVWYPTCTSSNGRYIVLNIIKIDICTIFYLHESQQKLPNKTIFSSWWSTWIIGDVCCIVALRKSSRLLKNSFDPLKGGGGGQYAFHPITFSCLILFLGSSSAWKLFWVTSLCNQCPKRASGKRHPVYFRFWLGCCYITSPGDSLRRDGSACLAKLVTTCDAWRADQVLYGSCTSAFTAMTLYCAHYARFSWRIKKFSAIQWLYRALCAAVSALAIYIRK